MVERLHSAVRILVERFVERQAIVLDALRDLRPDVIMRVEHQGSPELRKELRLKYAKEPTTGHWGENDEWAYRLHGIGCHLTHTVTGEVIGWDVGSLKTFDWHWFTDHLEWLLHTNVRNDEVEVIRSHIQSSDVNRETLRTFIFPVLEQLQDAGVLRKERENRYTLIAGT